MTDPISHCLERLYLQDDPKIKSRAEQFNGKLSKLPAKMFDKGPNCKNVICIQLAHESLKKEGWNNELAAQLAGCPAKSYELTLSIVRQRLDIQPTVTFEHLAVALGSTTMLKHIHTLWDKFTTKYIDELKGAKKMNAKKELELPCWKGAVVFACAKALGAQLNKDRLHSLCYCSITELNKSVKIVGSVSKSDLDDLKSKSKGKNDMATVESEKEGKSDDSKKRKRKDESVEKKPAPKAKPVSGITTMIGSQDYKNTKKYENYLKWKDELIKYLREEEDDADN